LEPLAQVFLVLWQQVLVLRFVVWQLELAFLLQVQAQERAYAREQLAQ
jgi:hypothetical protein